MNKPVLEPSIEVDNRANLINHRPELTDRQLAEYLKKFYKINFNISQNLSKSQKKEIINKLENNEAIRELVKTLVTKNIELSNNNRQFGRQREQAKRDFLESKERNEQLANEISLVRFQVNEMRKMLSSTLEIAQEQLVNNMLDRSEIIIVLKEMIKAVKKG
jgi:hypothetical protein